jgi:hypothetical protein
MMSRFGVATEAAAERLDRMHRWRKEAEVELAAALVLPVQEPRATNAARVIRMTIRHQNLRERVRNAATSREIEEALSDDFDQDDELEDPSD